MFLALPGEHTDGHKFVGAAAAAGAVGAVVSRKVDAPIPQVLVDDVARALRLAGAAWRAAFRAPVLGVAGSNGKTTTKEMLSAILAQRGECLATRGNLNNELGVPLTLLRLHPGFQSAVIEMGANHAGEIAALVRLARPAVGLITNAGAEHLEGFGSIEGVARAEGEMVAGLEASGTAIINADDAYAPLWRGLTRARVVNFGLGAGAEVRALGVRLDVGAGRIPDAFRAQVRARQRARGARPGRPPQRLQRARRRCGGDGRGRDAARGGRRAWARCARSPADSSSGRSPGARG